MPDTIVARMLGMKPRLMFQVSAAEKSPARLVLIRESLNLSQETISANLEFLA